MALTAALSGVGVIASTLQNTSTTDARPASRRMPDGKLWTTSNLSVPAEPSYCYDDAESNCRRYGRLYTWESAKRACQSLGDGWRLPTNDDWRQMAKPFGGVHGDSDDGGKAAFAALVAGGRSGFEVLYGGTRREHGEFARLDAHGFFWTASEIDGDHAWFYNLGRNGQMVTRHDGDKQIAISVRCIRE
jgi:uncharacterized protein (TIGR02145 family)